MKVLCVSVCSDCDMNRCSGWVVWWYRLSRFSVWLSICWLRLVMCLVVLVVGIIWLVVRMVLLVWCRCSSIWYCVVLFLVMVMIGW